MTTETLRTYLNSVIGFGSLVHATRVTNMDITNFDTLAKYKKEDVQSLCRTLCKDTTSPMIIGPIVEKANYSLCPSGPLLPNQ